MIKVEKSTVEFEGDRLMVLSDFALIVKRCSTQEPGWIK